MTKAVVLYLPQNLIDVIICDFTTLADHVMFSQVSKLLWLYYERTDFFQTACKYLGYILGNSNAYNPNPCSSYRALAYGLSRSSYVSQSVSAGAFGLGRKQILTTKIPLYLELDIRTAVAGPPEAKRLNIDAYDIRPQVPLNRARLKVIQQMHDWNRDSLFHRDFTLRIWYDSLHNQPLAVCFMGHVCLWDDRPAFINYLRIKPQSTSGRPLRPLLEVTGEDSSLSECLSCFDSNTHAFHERHRYE